MEKLQFSELNISEEIKKAVEDMGYEEATAIQTATIPLIMQGRDVIGHSQTGTGKTAAFGIPAIQACDPSSKNVQVLILCPTRELAMQACDEIRKFGKYMQGIKSVAIYGGQPIERQIKALKMGVQIVIGTPGRIMDHIRRRTLKFKALKMIILDEADEMLNMGFREDIETILKDVPEDRQTILFSATMSKEILGITKKYQTNPELVKIVHQQLTVPSIEQYYYNVPKGKKIEVLCRLLDTENPKRSIVFCNTKRQVDELVNELQLRGYLCDALHGDIKQHTRTQVMNALKKGKIDILIATDVAARGIDVDDVEGVFNYDLPQDEEYYVHRIGRTGRAGRSGTAYSLVTGRSQIMELRDIQKFTNSKITERAIPTISEVEQTKSVKIVNEIKAVMESGLQKESSEIVDKLLDEDFSSVEIATALVQMLFSTQKESKNILDDEFTNDSQAEAGMTRLKVSVGKDFKVCAKHIVGAIAGESGIRGKEIGKIEIFDSFSTVEVPSDSVDNILKAMQRCKINGKMTTTVRA